MDRRSAFIRYDASPASESHGPLKRAWRLLFGRPLATDEEAKEQIGTLTGIPVLGLDALASAAYGPEAALTVLLTLGLLGTVYMVPLAACIVLLLGIVLFSYRQTIHAYPSGGGSYTVARENLGERAGLLAAAALGLDYMLNVAVAISSGVGALVSAVPSLHPFQLSLCLAALAFIALVNLRGFRSTGAMFMAPTYLFIASLLGVVGVGLVRAVLSGGHPQPATPPVQMPQTLQVASLWLLLRAFASGCTAMTGVEAVSNGVPAFRSPSAGRARRSLTIIVSILAVLILGTAFLCRAYGVTATVPDQPGYQSVLSQVTAAVLGRGTGYYVTISAVVMVLLLSANTSFADFPRLCRLLAKDGYLPEPFEHRGRRLAFTVGILVLAASSALLLIAFRGITNELIPLFAVGAFTAFTLSQAGMVAHWRRHPTPRSRSYAVVNAVGAVATGVTLAIMLASKFTEGAWISVLLVFAMLSLFSGVKAHNRAITRALHSEEPLDVDVEPPPIAVVPLRAWNKMSRKALRFAINLSPEVYAIQVVTGDRPSENLADSWGRLVEEPTARRGRPIPRLVVMESEYRELFAPLEAFIRDLSQSHPKRWVAVIIPEFVEQRWFHYVFQIHTSSILKSLLLLHGESNIVVIHTPWLWRSRSRHIHAARTTDSD